MSEQTVVKITNIKREKGWMYYLKNGLELWRSKKGSEPVLVLADDKSSVRESGFLYFLDKQGNIAKKEMKRGGSKKKA